MSKSEIKRSWSAFWAVITAGNILGFLLRVHDGEVGWALFQITCVGIASYRLIEAIADDADVSQESP